MLPSIRRLVFPASLFFLFSLLAIPAYSADVPVSGKVLGNAGPLPGATVQLLPPWQEIDWNQSSGRESVSRHRAIRTTTSDSRGHFELSAPAPGLWRIRVSAPNKISQELALEPLMEALDLPAVTLPQASPMHLEIAAPEGLALEGWVAWPTSEGRSGQKVSTPKRPVWKPALTIRRINAEGRVSLPVPATTSDVNRPVHIPVLHIQVLHIQVLHCEPLQVPTAPGKTIPIQVVASQGPGLRITDSSGQGKPGAWIRRLADPVPGARTDSSGNALLAGLTTGPMSLEIIDSKGNRSLHRVTVGKDEEVRLRISPPTTLRGSVLTASDGRPIPGAWVWAYPLLPGRMAQTNSKGEFRFRILGDVPHRFRAAQHGFETGRLQVQRNSLVELTLQALSVGTGWVLDEDGQGIEGAEVLLAPSNSPGIAGTSELESGLLPEANRSAKHSLRTDSTGRFSLANPSSGLHDLEVRAEGFRSVQVHGLEIPSHQGAIEMGTFTLVVGLQLHGWVRDEEGNPVPGAEIAISEPTNSPGQQALLMQGVAQATTSDPDGRFTLDGLAETGLFQLQGNGKGFLPLNLTNVKLPAEDPLELVLLPAASLSGWVVNSQNQPVEGALVSVQTLAREEVDAQTRTSEGEDRSSLNLSNHRSALTGSDGRFVVDSLRPGDLTLNARSPREGRTETQRLRVSGGESRENIELRLALNARLAGTVRDHRGLGLARVSVFLESDPESPGNQPFAFTDSQGLFELEGLRPGQATLVAEDGSGRRTRQTVVISEATPPVDLLLEGGAAVRGRVADEAGAPIHGAAVQLLSLAGEGYSLQTSSDPDGSFSLDGVAAGRYVLAAEHSAFARTTLDRAVEVGEGRQVSDLHIVLPTGITLRGQVLGVGLDDLPRVVIRAAGSGADATGGVDYRGQFVLQNLPPGEVFLEAEIPGTGRRARQQLVLPAQAEGIALHLDGG